MLSVSLDNVGKKFGREWVFRKLSLEATYGSRIAVMGGNGSGKSTLLQVMAGYVTPNEGRLAMYRSDRPVPADEWHRYVSFASPYLQLPEDLTGHELVVHLAKFRRFLPVVKTGEVLDVAGLRRAAEKQIKQYSSGMKQRLKLALALLCEAEMVLLDEPASNLDRAAISWYRNMVETYAGGRTLVVCSNEQPEEYDFCDRRVSLLDYK